MGFVRYRDISRTQAGDTGMAMVLILLLIGFFSRETIYFISAIPVLLLNMIRPSFFRPLAVVWFGLSFLMGTVVSSVFLTIIFFIVVTPVGVFRRILGKDTLKLNAWKKDQSSVFKVRQTQTTSDSIKKPF